MAVSHGRGWIWWTLFAKRLASSEPMNKRRVYGRRIGRPLGSGRAQGLESLLPVLGLSDDILKEDGSVDPETLFGDKPEKIIFEIGFGNGEHLSALMRAEPGNGYIGAEPFINGMSAFLKDIKDMPNGNIRVLMDDALRIVKSLKSASVDSLYILNPDPWPKKRHYKRRIVRSETLNDYARVLKPGGFLVMTTDVDDLAEWMATQAFRHPAFHWTAKRADDWRTPPKDWQATRYEQKGRKAGRQQSYLIFERKP